MSHYDTLGVPREATQDDIKRAYRSKAAAAHPDREGGSAEAMAAINRANDCLSDPDRRAEYDVSGNDDLPQPPDSIAESVAMQLIAQALMDDKDLRVHCYAEIGKHRESAEQGRKALERLEAVLTKRRDKITTTLPRNFAHLVIDQKLVEIADKLKRFDLEAEVQAKVLAIVDAYQEERPEPPRLVGWPSSIPHPHRFNPGGFKPGGY